MRQRACLLAEASTDVNVDVDVDVAAAHLFCTPDVYTVARVCHDMGTRTHVGKNMKKKHGDVDVENFDGRLPPRMAPIGVKLWENTFQAICNISCFDVGHNFC